VTAPYPLPPSDAEGFAQLAADFLDDALQACQRCDLSPEAQALASIGYALLAVREQIADQQPRHHWWQRGGAR
jgi:hypothetical protein